MRTWTRQGISGLDVTYHFCATCPTIIVVGLQVMDGRMAVKSGLLDSAEDIERLEPKVEIFIKDRIDSWWQSVHSMAFRDKEEDGFIDTVDVEL
ncbi:hypothetical protein F5B22DRAFT_645320 [Xylaria bambusicola]|uniref:uncharacterized protein n=1 Tax=Xylaria bambusicola TaxID=326684 RepID=UPI0020081B0F|nr:uncharacterized protein F5B22DRAFT_645320 [Xylaria bambusicola]KAI0518070.1 hypothetical protein F5B22DRAFT_645320 [Xylaria bambusicola]